MKFWYNFQRNIVKLRASFIFDRDKKKVFKEENLSKIDELEMKNLKWGASYSVFDGLELLEASIKSIRESVDYINVVYQLKSWYGADCDPELYPTLLKMKESGLIDELIEFKPNFKKKPRTNEDNKRRLGLRYARKARVNYFMTMDADEFYIKEEFEKAKKYIVRNNIESAFCPIVDYGINPKKRRMRNAAFAVQFFFKLKPFTRLGKNKNAIAFADSTRTLAKPLFNVKQFMCLEVEMHHFSKTRFDLYSKYSNSSGRSDYDLERIKHIKDSDDSDDDYVEYKDLFNISKIFEGKI